MKKLIISLLIIISLMASVFGVNYFSLSKEMNDVINADYRNKSVDVSVHYENYINPNVLVFDIKKIGYTTSSADVFRVFWTFSSKMKKKKIDKVILSSKGKPKFYIKGDYYKQLGNKHNIENPIFIIRTFPENVYKNNGTKAFGTWTGGWLAVANKQMEEFNELMKIWFIDDNFR